MPNQRKNVIVGLTVLGALLGLTVLLMRGVGPLVRAAKGASEVHVQMRIDRADGLGEGSQVTFRGVGVGRVTLIRREENQQDVLVEAAIDNVPPLPANVTGVIRTPSLVSGVGVLSMELPVGARPTGTLSDRQQITARYVGSELIPPEFSAVASQLRDSQVVAHLDESVRQSSEVLRGLRAYVDDPVTRANLQVSIENMRHITEQTKQSADDVRRFAGGLAQVQADIQGTVKTTRAELDHVTGQIDDRMLQVSKLLTTAQEVAAKVDNGKGTAALLMNDPKLYEGLLDTTKQLNGTVADLRRLINQWEQEGVSLKLH